MPGVGLASGTDFGGSPLATSGLFMTDRHDRCGCSGDKIRCDACPVMCYIKPGAAGACDRYANHDGELVRVDPHIVLERTVSHGGRLVPFQAGGDWDGKIVHEPSVFVTAIGAGTTYPDYKPAPFIVSSEIDGVDMVTVVTEGIFSYCGVKVKIDTDRYLGPETATVRAQGEAIGHVTTSEYGSQMLSLGGVHHLTGGSKKEGRVTCDALMDLSNCKPVELTIDGGATVVVQAGHPPIVNGVAEERMRVGCGSATIGMFAKQWQGKVDEVVVVDDHITGVLSEHQAGKLLDIPDTGIKMKGRRSTPGRYFQVAEPGTGWGGTKISDPLSVLGPFDPKTARARHDHADGRHHRRTRGLLRTRRGAAAGREARCRPFSRLSVERIQENCEPALCTVLFMGGAGGSLRAGVTDNPVRLTRSVKDALTRVTSGGAPVYVWPGGGITFMVDVTRLPAGAFGYVPTPALVAPIEFTMKLSDYAGAWRPYGLRPSAGVAEGPHGNPTRCRPGRGGAMTTAPADRLAGGRQAAASAGRSDRPDRGSRGGEDGSRDGLSGRGAALHRPARRTLRRAAAVAPAPPIPRIACSRDRWRAACMPRWRRSPPCISSRRWRRSPARWRRKSLARCVRAARLARAYVNNGGDIALHLEDGEGFTVGLMDRPDAQGLLRTTRIASGDPSRGVATSGRHGRSFSLGIADAVTVLAPTAAASRCCGHHHRQRRGFAGTPSHHRAARHMICSPTAIWVRGWSPATSRRFRTARSPRRSAPGRPARVACWPQD